jgi:hypothetical protein
MASGRLFAATTAVLGLAALSHALLTWPLEATIALFAGGAVLAFVGEVVVVSLGWLEHHLGPKLAGVPLYVLPGWTAVIYVVVRVGLLVSDGWVVVLIAASLATSYDVLVDNRGVEEGHWTYAGGPPGPRHRNVPWWNYAGWFVVSGTTAAVTLPFL